MKEERIDFGILDAPATERHQTMPDGFHAWLLTDRAVGERWAKEISYIMGKILRELTDPIIDEEKAKKIALKVLTSKLSKSTKRHYLRALEHYMAYLGRPMKFKKPRDTLRCPVYLNQNQMSKLIQASRNYREMAVLTLPLFCTTGVRLGELVNIDIKDLTLSERTSGSAIARWISNVRFQ